MAERAIDRWRRAIRESDLAPVCRHVALELSEYMDYRTLANARPGPTRLAAQTGWSVRTVKRALAELVSLGWVIRTYEGGRGMARQASVYRGNVPVDRRW